MKLFKTPKLGLSLNYMATLLAMTATGCVFQPPKEITTPEQGSYYRSDIPKVRGIVIECFRTWGVPLREETEYRIRTKRIREGPISWRLNVELVQAVGYISVISEMELRTHSNVELVVDDLIGHLIDIEIENALVGDPRDDIEDAEEAYREGRISAVARHVRVDKAERDLEAQAFKWSAEHPKDARKKRYGIMNYQAQFHHFLDKYLPGAGF